MRLYTIVELPSGKIIDLSKFSAVPVPEENGDVYAYLDSGKIIRLSGADGRAFYAAQLARVGNKKDTAEFQPQRRNPHAENCNCSDCVNDRASRIRAEIETGARCPVCAKRREYCNEH